MTAATGYAMQAEGKEHRKRGPEWDPPSSLTLRLDQCHVGLDKGGAQSRGVGGAVAIARQHSAPQGLVKRGGRGVLVRQDGGVGQAVQRPGDAERRVERVHAVFASGSVRGRAQVRTVACSDSAMNP